MDHAKHVVGPRSTGAGATRPTRVRRTPEGSLDVGYYERRGRRLRARWLSSCFRRLWRRMVDACRRRAVINELSALDERTLHDIGIVRADIAAVARGDYARDATRRQRC